MKQNIQANLDLTKSLSDFQKTVMKLIELTDVKEWDGRIIKAREQQIREVALILAGQCIAILLYNLSQSQEALDTAMTQTQGWWRLKTRKHGYRKRQILTVGNVLVTEPIWFFQIFYGQLVVKCQVNKQRNRKFLKLLKPNPSLLINLSLLLIPSTGPLVVLLSK
jgi:hypothetical protein